MKKKVTVILLALLLVFTSIIPIYAADGEKYIPDKSKKFYTLSGLDTKELFNFTLGDITDPIGWVTDGKTYTVLQRVKDENGKEFIKGYFNTPGMSMLARNYVLGGIADGYTDNTYNIEDQVGGIVDVGPMAEKQNVITKYGFKLPNYIYTGEQPKVVMSTDNILPSGFFSSVWRSLKGFFGFSFINAPKEENYDSLTYMNHGYKDGTEVVLKFLQENWWPYFESHIDNSSFGSVENFIEAYVPETTKTSAEGRINQLHLEPTDDIKKIFELEDQIVGEEAGKVAKDIRQKLDEGLPIKSHEDGMEYSIPYRYEYQQYLEKKENGEDVEEPDYRDYTYKVRRDKLENIDEIIETYDKALDDIAKFEAFKEKFEAKSTPIQYRQCLIASEESGKCISTKHSDEPTSLSVAQVYALSGLHEVTKDFREGGSKRYVQTLPRHTAVLLMQKLQSITGPYYQEVLGNIIALMKTRADDKGVELSTDKYIDKRSMPYDLDTINVKDLENYTIKDPRNDIYKSHFIGYLLSSLGIKISLGPYMRLQTRLIDLAGRFTKWSVFFAQATNFEFMENLGLSITTFWSNSFGVLIIYALILLFIYKTVKHVILWLRGKSGKGTFYIIGLFILLFLEVGLVGAVTADPNRAWDTFKKPITFVMNLGEEISVKTDDTVDYLYDKYKYDPEVTYYLPYLNMWSKFNTGYNLFDEEQLIDKKDTVMEDAFIPKINGKEVKHYSTLLLDSFSYYGESNSLSGIYDQGLKKIINGPKINNNAYRVVDHYLAPKVHYRTHSDRNITMKTWTNPNYNGDFQNTFWTLLGQLINVMMLTLLSLMKYLTFLWLWYHIFILIVRYLLDKTFNHKPTKEILMPISYALGTMFIIGTFVGVFLRLSVIEGIVGILVQVFLFFIVKNALFAASNNRYFPNTLKPLVMLFNFKKMSEKRRSRRNRLDAMNEAQAIGFEISDEDMKDPDTYRDKLFNEEGDPRYFNSKYSHLYEHWKQDVEHRSKMGQEISEKDQEALNRLEEKLRGGKNDKEQNKKDMFNKS